jgi:hypothetical protein
LGKDPYQVDTRNILPTRDTALLLMRYGFTPQSKPAKVKAFVEEAFGLTDLPTHTQQQIIKQLAAIHTGIGDKRRKENDADQHPVPQPVATLLSSADLRKA